MAGRVLFYRARQNHPGAIRKLAFEAADNGLLAPELAAGIELSTYQQT